MLIDNLKKMYTVYNELFKLLHARKNQIVFADDNILYMYIWVAFESHYYSPLIDQ